MNDMKRKHLMTVLLSGIMLAALFFAFPAFAGWNTSGDQVTYTDAAGKKLTGLQEIKGNTFYFDGNGVLQTGFQKVGDDSYFFRRNGKAGVLGRAIKSDFRDLEDGRRIYLLPDGRMAVNAWVEKHTYYMDENGNMLKSTITKDGYVIKATGKAKKKQLKDSQFVRLGGKWYFFQKETGALKDQVFLFDGAYYYVNADGVRQTGWVTWQGHEYYFESDGKAVCGTKTIDGKSCTFNSEGQLMEKTDAGSTPETEEKKKKNSGKPSILILCGHGQGDVGAVGCNGKYAEHEYTRDFGKRIYEALRKTGDVNVELFNQNYDMFQQMRSTLVGVGSFSGNGNKAKKVRRAVALNARIPDPEQFDFVLEIHFNATGYNLKDPKGDKKIKGTGTYINSYKPAADRQIDLKIIGALNNLGLNTWGSGVYGSPNLLNAKTYNELGVNYTLLETCFIDDKDDMKFYMKNRDKMAEAIADVIAVYF